MQDFIVECSLRATLIALGAGVVLFVLRVRAARVQHAVWAGVVALMLTLPLWTLWGPKAVARVLRPAVAPAVTPVAMPVFLRRAPADAVVAYRQPATFSWRGALAAVYLLGLIALLARLAIGTLRAHRLVRRAGVQHGRLTSDACAVPLTVGLLKPAVILPVGWSDWPPSQLAAVLTHEGEHARRRDPLAQWLALLNRAIFWFHPLAWWLERRLSVLSEEACDAAVLAGGHDPFDYSESLMEMARAIERSGARVNLVAMAMPGASLPRRIRRILEGVPAPRVSRARLACLAVACTVVSALFTAGAVDYSRSETPVPVRASAPPASVPALEAAVWTAPVLPRRSSSRPQKKLLADAQSPARSNAASQTSAAALSGTVEDPSGARIVHCSVTVRDQFGNNIATEFTNAAGIYRFTSLAPGRYGLEFAAPGFALRAITVTAVAGQPSRVDAALYLGQATQSVTVTAAKPLSPAAPSNAQSMPAPGPFAVGGRVRAAMLIRQPQPVYPPELRAQGIEGTVIVRAVISRDGSLQNIHLLNADEIDPRFAQAALDSLGKWRYQPTLLNQEPVDTLTTIEVAFQLGN